jgi:hypothetical protein
MSPLTLILPAVAYTVLAAALGLAMGPALGLALFGAAAGAHGLWLAVRAANDAENVQRARMEVDGHAHIAFFHAPHGGQRSTHALGQRGLGDMAPPAGQGDVCAKLTDGAFDGQGKR